MCACVHVSLTCILFAFQPHNICCMKSVEFESQLRLLYDYAIALAGVLRATSWCCHCSGRILLSTTRNRRSTMSRYVLRESFCGLGLLFITNKLGSPYPKKHSRRARAPCRADVGGRASLRSILKIF